MLTIVFSSCIMLDMYLVLHKDLLNGLNTEWSGDSGGQICEIAQSLPPDR